jgi:hypothetical protein
MDKTAIFIPSLNRPHLLKGLVLNIREMTPEPHAIYFMVSDDESIKVLDSLNVNYWRDSGDTRYVTRMNYMYKHTIEPYMFMSSDDILFHKDWLKNVLTKMDNYSVVVGDDMLNANGTMALIKRKYIDEQSGCVDTPDVLFYPGYGHDFADTEQFETAMHRGVFTRAHDSVVEHLHWSGNKSPKDATYELSAAHSKDDLALYLSRKHLWS